MDKFLALNSTDCVLPEYCNLSKVSATWRCQTFLSQIVQSTASNWNMQWKGEVEVIDGEELAPIFVFNLPKAVFLT